jgi:1-phosphofructokinase family hexose kinase
VIACVALTPSIDRTLVVERLVRGAIHRPTSVVQVAGGKGLNVARAAAVLGGAVHAVAPLAGHAGRWIADELAAEGVEATVLWTDGETRACLSVADAERGDLTEFYEPSAPLPGAVWDAVVAATAAVAAGAAWVTISGSPPGAGIAALVAAARDAGARVALDAHGATLRDGLAAGVDLVKVNREEASEAVGAAGDPPAAELARALRELDGRDHRAAIVTDGAAGLVLVAPDGAALTARGDTRGAYPQGSGDSFLGGLAAALDVGAAWDGALRLGLGAAAANAEQPGAGRLDPERARALAARASVSAVPDA